MSNHHIRTKLKNCFKFYGAKHPQAQRPWLWRIVVGQLGLLLPKNLWVRRLLVSLGVILIITILGMYGIARWYIASQASQPLQLGVSFSADYAASLGLSPPATLHALISQVGVRNFRLVSYWNDIEPQAGHYDFSQLDWQFKQAEVAKAKIILTVGLRQPRWPECHMPGWASNEPAAKWQPQLASFIQAVVLRYRNSPSLSAYQLENEYFLHGFGKCQDFSRNRLVSEYNLVKQLDPAHRVIVGRSNNAIGLPIGQPQPDEFSISVYKRVWDAAVTHRYLEHPYPAWFYGFLAGLQEIVNHKNMVIGELQAEAWPPNGQTIQQSSLAEQNKSLDAGRLKARFSYGKATGMRTIDMWGAEYWYYRLKILHDPSLWLTAEREFQSSH